MRMRLLLFLGALTTLLVSGSDQGQLLEADALRPLLRPEMESEMCLMPRGGVAVPADSRRRRRWKDH